MGRGKKDEEIVLILIYYYFIYDVLFSGLKIIPVPMLKDNYAYIIIETRSRKTVVIDPGDAHAVQVGYFFFFFLLLQAVSLLLIFQDYS